jgi:hypothetical protein
MWHKLANLKFCGLPAMRQQSFKLTIFLCRQTNQHIPEAGIRIMPVELGALNQTHHRTGALARSQRTGKELIVATNVQGLCGDPWNFSCQQGGFAICVRDNNDRDDLETELEMNYGVAIA